MNTPKLPSLSKVPFLNTPDKPLVASTQYLIPIADIVDGIVLFKSGGAALVMETTSLNFGLLSEREQDAVIASYAALINSLSFPIQIVVITQKKDITKYLNYLSQAGTKIQNQKLQGLMNSYRQFIEETIKKKNVLGKRFFIVIPFSQYELGISAKSLVNPIGQKKQKKVPYSKEYVLSKAKISLYPKRDHLIKQMGRLGLHIHELSREELVNLYYEIFNPSAEEVQSKEETQDESAKAQN